MSLARIVVGNKFHVIIPVYCSILYAFVTPTSLKHVITNRNVVKIVILIRVLIQIYANITADIQRNGVEMTLLNSNNVLHDCNVQNLTLTLPT